MSIETVRTIAVTIARRNGPEPMATDVASTPPIVGPGNPAGAGTTVAPVVDEAPPCTIGDGEETPRRIAEPAICSSAVVTSAGSVLNRARRSTALARSVEHVLIARGDSQNVRRHELLQQVTTGLLVQSPHAAHLRQRQLQARHFQILSLDEVQPVGALTGRVHGNRGHVPPPSEPTSAPVPVASRRVVPGFSPAASRPGDDRERRRPEREKKQSFNNAVRHDDLRVQVVATVGFEPSPRVSVSALRPRPQRLIRSPSVERLICNSSAARDLLPLLIFNAQPMRFASRSRMRSSSDNGAPSTGSAIAGATPVRVGGGAPARSRMLADMQPMRTVPHVHVCAIRSQAFSSSRTLPGQA